jgi:hypothetical protein
MSWIWYVWIGIGLTMLGMATPYLLHRPKHRQAREAFNRQSRYCDCGGCRRYIRIVEGLVEDCCIDCGRTRVMTLAEAIEHGCSNIDLISMGPEVEDGEWKVQEFRCRICGVKHESIDGLMDTAFGGV